MSAILELVELELVELVVLQLVEVDIQVGTQLVEVGIQLVEVDIQLVDKVVAVPQSSYCCIHDNTNSVAPDIGIILFSKATESRLGDKHKRQ